MPPPARVCTYIPPCGWTRETDKALARATLSRPPKTECARRRGVATVEQAPDNDFPRSPKGRRAAGGDGTARTPHERRIPVHALASFVCRSSQRLFLYRRGARGAGSFPADRANASPHYVPLALATDCRNVMAPRDNQELVPLTDGSGHANDEDQLDGQCRRKTVTGARLGGGGGGGDDDDRKDGLTVHASINDTKTSVIACQQIVGMGTLWRFPYVCLKYGGGKYSFNVSPYICLYYIVYKLH